MTSCLSGTFSAQKVSFFGDIFFFRWSVDAQLGFWRALWNLGVLQNEGEAPDDPRKRGGRVFDGVPRVS
jgi:hypothetical protein